MMCTERAILLSREAREELEQLKRENQERHEERQSLSPNEASQREDN